MALQEVAGADIAGHDFQEITGSRFDWHRRQVEPDGPGTRGPMVGPVASGMVISDLEDMIVDMVRSLTQDEEEPNFTAWRERWTRAAWQGV